MIKVCSTCKEEKEVSEFYKQKRNKDGLAGICKLCWAIGGRKNGRAYYHRNKKRRQEESRKYTMLRRFGIDPEEYDKMYHNQSGCCAICDTHQQELPMRLAIDHNHATGKVRSLLCGECNLGLGKFKDDPELLRQAVQYLDLWGTNSD